MNRPYVVAGSAAAVVLAVVLAAVALGAALSDDDSARAEELKAGRGIAVSGEGLVRVRPDTAFVDLGIQATAESVGTAVAAAASKMESVVNALKKNGLTDDDIQTTAFSIQPQYDYRDGTTTLRGYSVTNSVSARIKRDTASVATAAGKVIDDAAAAGGDNTVIQGIRFSVDDQSGAVTQARDLAVKNAREKADQLARNAGVTLGHPIAISESTAVPGPVYAGDREAPAEPSKTPIQAGLLTVTVSVSITYEIG